mgnify:CR=1 FL=1
MVHAYFAPVTPPPANNAARHGYCRCCVILWGLQYRYPPPLAIDPRTYVNYVRYIAPQTGFGLHLMRGLEQNYWLIHNMPYYVLLLNVFDHQALLFRTIYGNEYPMPFFLPDVNTRDNYMVPYRFRPFYQPMYYYRYFLPNVGCLYFC